MKRYKIRNLLMCGFIVAMPQCTKQKPKTSVKYTLTELREDTTTAEIQIGSYKTSYANSSKNRINNIELAAEILDGVVINPNEVFSFNSIIGRRTEDRGFKTAHVISQGKMINGTGGGICQLSSTLYNSVLQASCKVVERHGHSLPIGYVPVGKDATVSYGTLDFRFRNTFKVPLKIKTVCENKKLTVIIYKLEPRVIKTSRNILTNKVDTLNEPSPYIVNW